MKLPYANKNESINRSVAKAVLTIVPIMFMAETPVDFCLHVLDVD